MNDMGDDFLWASALVYRSEGDNRLDVIPDHEDDMSQFGNIKVRDNAVDGSCHADAAVTVMAPLSHVRYRRCVQSLSTSEDIDIEIVESRGCGVLDIIGGELWQGSLILCAYLLMRVPRRLLLQADVLELGSGVGLPAMLLIALKSLFSTVMHDNNHDSDDNEDDKSVRSVVMNAMRVGRVVLSDNDSRVINNLRSAVSKQFEEEHSSSSHSDDVGCDIRGDDDAVVVPSISSNYVPVAIHRLDWRHCMEVKYTHPQSKLISDSSQLQCDNEDDDRAHAKHRVIIGSELCYSKSHATYLARLIKSHLLCPHKQLRYDEVIICQVRDREGFAELLSLLDDNGDDDSGDDDDDDELSNKIAYIVEEVPEAVFAMGQRIEKKANVYSCCTSDDGSNGGSIYRFPAAILQDIFSCAYDDSSVMPHQGIDPEVSLTSLHECSIHHQLEMDESNHHQLVMDESHHSSSFRSHLINTDITAFVILRIKAVRTVSS